MRVTSELRSEDHRTKENRTSERSKERKHTGQVRVKNEMRSGTLQRGRMHCYPTDAKVKEEPFISLHTGNQLESELIGVPEQQGHRLSSYHTESFLVFLKTHLFMQKHFQCWKM